MANGTKSTKKASNSPAPEPVVEAGNETTGRDVRVDRIFLTDTLDTLFAQPIRDDVKQKMVDGGFKTLTGDLAQGLLVTPENNGKIDPTELYKLVVRKRITLDQFLSVLTVNKKQTTEILSGSEIAAISKIDPAAKPSPQLRVSVLKGILVPKLPDVIQAISKAAMG